VDATNSDLAVDPDAKLLNIRPPSDWSNFTKIRGTPRVMQIGLRLSKLSGQVGQTKTERRALLDERFFQQGNANALLRGRQQLGKHSNTSTAPHV
jgi:hypothetical protein